MAARVKAEVLWSNRKSCNHKECLGKDEGVLAITEGVLAITEEVLAITEEVLAITEEVLGDHRGSLGDHRGSLGNHRGSLGTFSRARRGLPAPAAAEAGADCANRQVTRGAERARP